jgi:multisubunit Na+/H+ antiporter MnhC subunit
MSQTAAMGYLLYGGALALVLIGLYAMVARSHLIRMLLGLMILEAGVNLALVAAGYRGDAAAPILGPVEAGRSLVDPIPQALILTAIVIGVGVIAFALALVVRVYRDYGTVDAGALGRALARESPPGEGSAAVAEAEQEPRQ